MRRDLQGVLLTLSWYLFNVNNNFMQHHVYPPQALYTGPCNYAGTFTSNMLTNDDDGGDGLDSAQHAQQDAFQEQTTVTDLVNIFGSHHGLDAIVSALQAPDRCGVHGVHMFTNVISFAMVSLIQEYREEAKPAVQAVLKYIHQGFSAAEDFSVFEEESGGSEGDDVQPAYQILALIMHCCCDISSYFSDGGLEECGMAAPLQRELVSRLLKSGHFTRQLAAVKELYQLHCRAARWGTGENGGGGGGDGDEEEAAAAAGASASPSFPPASLQAFIEWIGTEKIVDQILKTNLHQPQYSEAVQKLLVPLARYGSVTSAHISFLWELIEDAATFEDIKLNVCSILGALTPHLPLETQRNVLQRAAEMALSESPPLLTLSLKLLESISRNDSQYIMPHEVLNTLCSIILRTEAPLEAATSECLSDACLRYIECSAPGTERDWARLVTEKCTEALKSGKGGVPAAYQLFETFTKIVPAYFPKPELERAYFEDINHNAKLLVLSMEAYSAFLAHQRSAMAAAGTTTSAPPVGCISHAVAVEKYHRMIAELVVRGNYFITCVQLNKILNWATVEAATPADSDSSWRLLILMVHERRKEIEPKAAIEFLLHSLCAVQPKYMTWSGWRCLTLYMAAVNNWHIDIKSREGYELYDLTNEVVLTSESQWVAWRSVLLSTALHAKEPVSSRASALLSRLAANDAQTVFSAEKYTELLETELSTWQNELKTAVQTLCGRLPESGWHDAPPLDKNRFSSLSSDKESQEKMTRAANTAKCALSYLQQLIENGQAKSLPVHFAHAASYRDSAANIDLQLPGTQISQKISVTLPKNSYVGVLRAVAAQKLSVALNRHIPPSVLRLLTAGKELIDDGISINRAPGLKPNVHLAYLPQPNPAWEVSTLPQAAREELMASGSEVASAVGLVSLSTSASSALAAAAEESPNCNVYSLALAMEQIYLPKECDPTGMSGFVLRTAAKGLLNALPTCTKAIEDVQRLLLTSGDVGSHESSRTSLLRIISSPDGTFHPAASISKNAVLRYLVEVLCVLMLPSNNPLETDDFTAHAEERAAALQTRLFASGVMQTLLEVAAVVPATQAVSAAADHQLHSAMNLLLSNVSEDILNRKNFALEGTEAGAVENQEGTALATAAGGAASAGVDNVVDDGVKAEDALAVHAIATYTLATMQAALGKEQISSQLLASLPPPLISSPDNSSVWSCMTDDLCYKGLNLLRTCIEGVPTLATVLVSPSHAPLPSTTFTAEEQQQQQQSIDAVRLSKILITLLSHYKPPIRAAVTRWIHRFVAASPEARSWTFSNIITPLLLASDSNDDQTCLISSFLSNLNAEEAVVAESVLTQLVQRLIQAMETGNIAPVKATTESVLILIRKLDCHGVVESTGLVTKLLGCCLFPELDVLASVHPEKACKVGVEAIFEGHPRALLAAQHSLACREVCFELLFELITHNKSSWDAARPIFLRFIDAGTSIFPFLFRNSPLSSLRLPNSLCGLSNGGATCYMNATFQQLYMQPTVRRLILSAPAVPEDEQEDSVFHQVQTMFAHLAAGVAPFYEPRGFWRAFKDYEGQSVNIREHQDAYEFFTRLQDSVDEHLHSRGHPRAIHAALGGTFAQVITVAGRPELRSQRDEDFYQVSLDVRGKKGLTESLESYVAVEMMNGENQWLCEELGKKVDAEKRTLIGSLPNTLMLHLKRFEWDYETYSRWKVKDRFEFPLELDMKPYTVEGCTAATEDLPAHPDAYYKYELRGIVVHSGTAFAGHYYSYIKDRTNGGAQWNLFDDTSVDPWDPVTLDEDCFGGKYRPDGSTQEYDRPNSAYMLIYERIEPVEDEAAEKSAAAAVAAAGGGQVENEPSDELMLPQGPGAEEGLNIVQQEAVARVNLANIATVHLLAPELLNFFTLLARELRLAASGGGTKSRKIARGVGFTSPNGGGTLASASGAGGSSTAANNNNVGLARMASSRHRPEEIADILIGATSLCSSYFYNVLARGPITLINDISARKGDSFIAQLTSAIRPSVYVSYTFLQGPGELAGVGADRQGITLAITSLHSAIRESARTMMSCAVKSVLSVHGKEIVVALLRPIIDILMAQLAFVKNRMAHPVNSCSNWDEILAFLDEIFCDYEGLIELAMPRVETLLEIGPSLVAGFLSLTDEDKLDYDFGKSYLSLLGLVLCRYDHTYLSAGDGTLVNDGGDGGGNGGEVTNPYCIVDEVGTPVPPLPKDVWDFFFEDETFLRRLLLPGCLNSSNACRLVQWLWYNNFTKHNTITKAVMEHIDDDLYGLDELLAAELPQLVEILTMKDILTTDRYREALLGEPEIDDTDGAGNNGTNTQTDRRWGLIESTEVKNRLYRVVMLIRIIVSMYHANEAAFYEVVELNGNDSGRVQEWARNACERVETLHHNIQISSKAVSRWRDLSNECTNDAETWFRLDELNDRLIDIAGDYDYDEEEQDDQDTDDVNLPGGGGGLGALFQQQYPQPLGGMQGGYQGGFGIHGAFVQAGNAATNSGFAFGLLQPSALSHQQQQQLLLAQHQPQQQAIIGPALPPPASTPFASMDLGAPPLQGPAAVITQGAGRHASATGGGGGASTIRQADISAGEDANQDDELVAEIELDGSGEEEENGGGGANSGAVE
jgi:ubiquitin C-terminal hydrolase